MGEVKRISIITGRKLKAPPKDPYAPANLRGASDERLVELWMAAKRSRAMFENDAEDGSHAARLGLDVARKRADACDLEAKRRREERHNRENGHG